MLNLGSLPEAMSEPTTTALHFSAIPWSLYKTCIALTVQGYTQHILEVATSATLLSVDVHLFADNSAGASVGGQQPRAPSQRACPSVPGDCTEMHYTGDVTVRVI